MLWTRIFNFCLLPSVVFAGLVQYPLNPDQSIIPSDLDSDGDLSKFPEWLRNRTTEARPLARPCYELPQGSHNASACCTAQVYKAYDVWTADQPGGYYYANWGSCQASLEMCAMPVNNTPISDKKWCLRGNLPSYMFKPDSAEDVKALFELANQDNWTYPLIIKNTGHDWMGRSAGAGSLGVWTHHWRHPAKPIELERGFVPEGCNSSNGRHLLEHGETVFHFGAGEQWGNAYRVASKNGLAVLGGTCPTVGVAGWLSGGGHSPLTPWYGMGVDNVRQIEMVTPKGDVLVANECLNSDLFFAVRGGGGGTFGLVTKITYKALQKFEVVRFSAKFDFPLDVEDVVFSYFKVLTSNAQHWASKGWGGYIKSTKTGQIIEIINANSTLENAKSDLADLTQYVAGIGKVSTLETYNSWYDYVDEVLRPAEAHPGGSSTAVASRLVNSTIFEDELRKLELTETLTDIWKNDVNMWLMLVTPTKFPHTDTSALHPSWKTAIWSVRLNSKWDQYFSNDAKEIRDHFNKAHTEMDKIRNLRPGMGVSINEADIWEVDRPAAYWGIDNHERLKKIKKEVDPKNILTNWGAVMWNEKDGRYKCYPRK